MPDYLSLKAKIEELAQRHWGLEEIEKRFQKLMREGIPRKVLDPNEILANKQQIVERVQRLGEEYEFLSHS
jgi:hypothetical protein